MDAYGINRDSYFLFIVFSFVWYPPPKKYQHLCQTFSDIGAVLTSDDMIAVIHFLNFDPHQRTDSYHLPRCQFPQYQSFLPKPLPHWG